MSLTRCGRCGIIGFNLDPSFHAEYCKVNINVNRSSKVFKFYYRNSSDISNRIKIHIEDTLNYLQIEYVQDGLNDNRIVVPRLIGELLMFWYNEAYKTFNMEFDEFLKRALHGQNGKANTM